MWEGRATPLVHTDSLKEAYLGWLQGMKQGAPFCRPGYRTLRKPGRTLQHNLLLTVSQMAPRCQLLGSLTLRSSDPSSGLVNVRAAGQHAGLDQSSLGRACACGCAEARVCLVAAEDAAAQHEVTFRQWRENPAAFGIGDRYPVDEVFAEAKNAWQRAHPAR